MMDSDEVTCHMLPCTDHGTLSQRLEPLQQSLSANFESRERSNKLARTASRNLELAQYQLHHTKNLELTAFMSRVLDIVKQSVPEVEGPFGETEEEDTTEEGSWGVMQRFVQIVAFAHFKADPTTCISLQQLQALLSEVCPNLQLSDDVYLGGIMWLVEDLSQYAIQQRSLSTGVHCRDMCSALWGEFQLFDFRNSWLRRRFDGIKYRVKELEDLCFALANKEGNPGAITIHIPSEDLGLIRERMKLYDAKREEVIKACRPLQKNAKNAIYRLLNGRLQEADELLKSTLEGAVQLNTAIIEQNPSLRSRN